MRMLLATLFTASILLTGCADKAAPMPKAGTAAQPADAVAVERGKLGADDRALVDAQEWCVVSTDQRLGTMGTPIKLTIKGQPVFICCGGCRKKAEADPDKTIAKLEELKAKKTAGAPRSTP